MIEQEDKFSVDLYSMILSGLIALHIAQKEGLISFSSGAESIFLGKWLKIAKKQRLFPKSISSEIDNLLLTYAKKGRSANLGHTFSQISTEYQVCKVKLEAFETSPKERFMEAMEMLTSQEWFASLPVDHDFDSHGPYKPTNVKEVFMKESDWLSMFDTDGNISTTVSLFVASDPQQVIDCLHAHGFILITVAQDKDIHHHYKIFPGNQYKGEVAIPTKFMP